MKANEAPEKLYIDASNKLSDSIFYGFTERKDGDIEYIRKDAFIKKVVRFMKKIGDTEEYTWYNEEEHAVGITKKCIEDFKKHMNEDS